MRALMELYRRIPIRYRIAVGLVGLMTGTILFAGALGYIPNVHHRTLNDRAQFCGALAVSSTVMIANDKDRQNLQVVIDTIVDRNNEVHSIAFRDVEGELLLKAGNHEKHWMLGQGNSARQIRLPIFQKSKPWGQIEVSFADTSGFLGLNHYGPAWVIVFMVPMCILQFSFFLSKTLENFDPDGAMPRKTREVLNTFTEGLLLIDARDRILFANDRLANLIGMKPVEMMGKTTSDLPWIIPDYERAILPWNEAKQRDEFVSDRILHFRHGERMLTLQVNSTPITGKGVMATFDDITLIEENKEKLAVALGAAKDASEAKSAFLANMSHEIRTPLNAVLGFTDVLRRGLVSDSDEALDHLNMIHRSGAHLLELINDILDLSKIEANRMQVESIDTEVVSIVLDVADVLRVRATDKEIGLVTRFKSDIPATIQADPTRLRQVITNLVGNAIKFTEDGEVSVVVELSDDSSILQIHVQDSGIGMTPEQQSKIFESFVQADSTTTRKFGGTGLGLSISRRLTEAMGGELTVESEPNVGSVFTVSLRVLESDLENTLTPQEIEETASQRAGANADGTIRRLPAKPVLVVDDGDANRRLIKLVLGRAGAQVSTAENGLEAIEAIKQNEFALVFMDMQMPVLDGYSATKQLRDEGFTIPIVALTGNAMKGDREKCIEMGCDDFLSKPVNLDDLLDCSLRHLGQTEAGDSDAESETVVGVPISFQAHAEPDTKPSNNESESFIHSTLPMDDEEFRDVVSDFIGRLDDRLNQIETAFSEGDLDMVQTEAHWLKGSGGTVGFAQLGDTAATLEAAAKDGETELADAILLQIRDIQSRLVDPVIQGDSESTSEESETADCDESNEKDESKPEFASTEVASEGPIHSTLPLDDEEFCAIVRGFVERLDERLVGMKELLDAEQYEPLGNEAHWLKGAGGTVGYSEFMPPAVRLLNAARTENKPDCAEALAEINDVRSRLVVPAH